jgi:hypothetical protein
MTVREKNIVIIGAVLVVGVLLYNFLFGAFAPSADSQLGGSSVQMDYDTAFRLLQRAPYVTEYNKQITTKLKKLKDMFYPKSRVEEAEIDLLKETEQIAAACNLSIQQKNIIRYSETLIGVTLDGKTSPDSLFRFMQKTTESRLGLKINRLQIHTMNDQKLVDYQISVSSMLL